MRIINGIESGSPLTYKAVGVPGQPITPSDVADGRRIASTHDGPRVLVPAMTEAGDLIVAFLGIRLHFVIRRYHNPRHGTMWLVLVGACDIEGNLTWEALGAKDRRLREIVLCLVCYK